MPNCKTCNKYLHKEANFCPNCRDPNPFTQDTDFKSLFIVLAGLAGIGFFLYIFFQIALVFVVVLDRYAIIFWKAVGILIVIAAPFGFLKFLLSKNPHIPKSAKYFVSIFSVAIAVVILAG